MATKNYVNLYKDDETIRITILTNLYRMMITRGYISLDRYRLEDRTSEKENVVEQATNNDLIDNSKIYPLINKRLENNIYKIKLDKAYVDERQEKNDFDGKTIVVKIIPQIVKDITNSPIVNDFLKSYTNYHKIIIFDGMTDRVSNTISRKYNLEAFEKSYLMIDLMSHYCAPLRCDILNDDDVKHIINPKFSKILENDPLAKYYNAKRGNIMRIERTSLNNSNDVGYRRVIEPKPVFK